MAEGQESRYGSTTPLSLFGQTIQLVHPQTYHGTGNEPSNFNSVDSGPVTPLRKAQNDDLRLANTFHPDQSVYRIDDRRNSNTFSSPRLQNSSSQMKYQNHVIYQANSCGSSEKLERNCDSAEHDLPSDIPSDDDDDNHQNLLDQKLNCKRSTKSKKRKSEESRDNQGVSHLLTERRRREKMNDMFLQLRAVVPTITKMNKLATLNDAINYIKKMESDVLLLKKELNDLKSKPFEQEREETVRSDRSHVGGKNLKIVPRSPVYPVKVEVTFINDQLEFLIRSTYRPSFVTEVGVVVESLLLEVRQLSVNSWSNRNVTVLLVVGPVPEDKKGRENEYKIYLEEKLSLGI